MVLKGGLNFFKQMESKIDKKNKKTELNKTGEKLKTSAFMDNFHKMIPPMNVLKETNLNKLEIIYTYKDLVLFKDGFGVVYILNGFEIKEVITQISLINRHRFGRSALVGHGFFT